MGLTSGKYSKNEEIAYSYFRAQGLSLETTCGLLANISSESGFNPTARNSNENAYGICQWEAGRDNNLYNYTKTTSPSFSQQLSFIMHELNGSEKSAKGKILGVSSGKSGASDAGYNVAKYYERCNSAYHSPRAKLAQEYYDYYSKGTVSVVPISDITYNDSNSSVNDPNVSRSPGSVTIGNSNLLGSSEYNSSLLSRLSELQAEGYTLGSLTALQNGGGEFRFYIPEFTEQAGANWDFINIPGRSIQIASYNDTTSRVITVNLDLYASAGLYTSRTDPVGDLHRDVNFLKSLEYPDYDTTHIIQPPSQVLLTLGPVIQMEGVVTSVSVQHLKPFDTQNRAMYMKVSFTVKQNQANPPGCADIKNGVTAALSITPTVESKSNNLTGGGRGIMVQTIK